MDGEKRFNVYLRPEFIRKAKYRALDEQISLRELVQRALKRYFIQEAPVYVVADLGLTPQPMIHVESMADALRFYDALGAKLLFCSQDGDWAMIDLAGNT